MYYKNRILSIPLARFLQRDPLGVQNGIGIGSWGGSGSTRRPRPFRPTWQYIDGASLYSYCDANPVRKVDVFGTVVTCPRDCRPSLVGRAPGTRPPGGSPASNGFVDWPRFVVRSGNVRPKECCPDEVKVAVRYCRCTFDHQSYYYMTEEPIDKEGNTPYEHEMNHVEQISNNWQSLMTIIDGIVDMPCMNRGAANCFRNVIELARRGHELQVKAEGAEFDCRVYFDDDPSKERTCNAATLYREQADQLIGRSCVMWGQCQQEAEQ